MPITYCLGAPQRGSVAAYVRRLKRRYWPLILRRALMGELLAWNGSWTRWEQSLGRLRLYGCWRLRDISIAKNFCGSCYPVYWRPFCFGCWSEKSQLSQSLSNHFLAEYARCRFPFADCFSALAFF